MSLLTQASLILTPTAYKASKLYSIVPSNANGDMTVVRATAATATRLNSSGVVELVGVNVPRLNYDSLGSASILLEPQRTNVLLNSATLATQSVTTTAVSYSLSFYGTGTITLSGAFVGTLVGTGVSNRVSLTFTSTAAPLTLTVTGSVTNAQLEVGAYSTSYIPTIGIALTRNADVFSLTNVFTNGLITSSGGTWFVELINNIGYIRDLSSNSFIGTTTNGNTNTSFGIRNSGTTSAPLTLYKRELGTLTSSSTISTENAKVLVKWNGTTADYFINGIKVVSATAHTTTVMEFLTLTGADVPKYIKSMMLFPTPLTDAECTSLTTL